ncbi:MAG: hypothetical protein KGI11_07005 [Thaumarchaeota archaeon]|nr:hypothetical protein [Nitrososphaerota archaeon]
MKSKHKFSISLDNETFERLRVISEKENVSMNRLINQTLENYTIWNLRNAEFIPIRKSLIAILLDKFSHEEMEAIASNMARTKNTDTVLQFTSKFDASNVLKTADRWLRLTGFPYSYDVKDSVHRFVVLHDLGEKWSLYLTKLLSSTLNQLDIIPKYEYTDKILSITIDFSQTKDTKTDTDKQVKVPNSTPRRRNR